VAMMLISLKIIALGICFSGKICLKFNTFLFNV